MALTTKFAPDNTLCVEALGCWVIAVTVFISTAVGELVELAQPLTVEITVYAPDSDVVKVVAVDPDNAVPFLYHWLPEVALEVNVTSSPGHKLVDEPAEMLGVLGMAFTTIAPEAFEVGVPQAPVTTH